MSGSLRILALFLLAVPAIAVGFGVHWLVLGTAPASFLARLGTGFLALLSTCVALYGFLRLLGWVLVCSNKSPLELGAFTSQGSHSSRPQPKTLPDRNTLTAFQKEKTHSKAVEYANMVEKHLPNERD